MGAGLFDLSQKFYDPSVQALYEQYLAESGARDFLAVGGYMPLNGAFVGETTRFREFGPIAGHTFRFSVVYSPPISESWVSRAIYEADLRKYIHVTNRSLFALRLRGFDSQGSDPVIFAYGGGLDIRGFDYREVTGNQGYIFNGEYRFPAFPNPRIPILGQLRAKVFFDNFRIA